MEAMHNPTDLPPGFKMTELGPIPVGAQRAVPLRETEIGPVPAHWQVVRLGEVAETKSGGTPNRAKSEYYGGPIPWVKSGELQDGFINQTAETLTEVGLTQSNAKVFPAGTLLVAMYDATAGKVGILGINAATNQAVCAIFPDKRTMSDYLFYVFVWRREELLGERYGGAQPNISQIALKSFSLPLPPLVEQQEIARILGAVDEKIAAEERRKAALAALFKSLLAHLMTGRVRVPPIIVGAQRRCAPTGNAP